MFDFTNIKTIEINNYLDDDWEEIKLDGEVYDEGHSIPLDAWAYLLKKLGYNVVLKEIYDDEEIDITDELEDEE